MKTPSPRLRAALTTCREGDAMRRAYEEWLEAHGNEHVIAEVCEAVLAEFPRITSIRVDASRDGDTFGANVFATFAGGEAYDAAGNVRDSTLRTYRNEIDVLDLLYQYLGVAPDVLGPAFKASKLYARKPGVDAAVGKIMEILAQADHNGLPAALVGELAFAVGQLS